MHDVVVIGGGLAGLTSASLLAREGFHVLVLEKTKYPAHKVCGEYVSQEVIPLLRELGIWPFPFNTPLIQRVRMTSPGGKQVSEDLDMGGFGISRYQFDYHFARKAKAWGAEVQEGTKVQGVAYQPEKDTFSIQTHKGYHYARLVLGNFGKRSVMDRYLKRRFLNRPSPYVGVKHHIVADAPKDEVALHCFPQGYCGVSRVENDRYSFCYLVRREALKQAGGIPELERTVLQQNPFLEKLFQEGHFYWSKPLVINEISFEQKSLVHNHVVTSGDASGMITPLCGNGMAMAIRGSQLLVEHALPFLRGKQSRQSFEAAYQKAWQKQFSKRMEVGKFLQDYGFGHKRYTDWTVNLFKMAPFLRRNIIKKTHGQANL